MKRKLYWFLAWTLFIGTGLLFGLHWTDKLRVPWPLLFYAAASCLTFWAYYSDKKAARAGRWRASEGGLHFMELLGGWPGALIARQLFRHKTAKWSYRFIFWLIVLLHLGLLYTWFFVLNCGLYNCSGEMLWQGASEMMKQLFKQAGLPAFH